MKSDLLQQAANQKNEVLNMLSIPDRFTRSKRHLDLMDAKEQSKEETADKGLINAIDSVESSEKKQDLSEVLDESIAKASNIEAIRISLDNLIIGDNYNPRISSNPDTIEKYAIDIINGHIFPPLVVEKADDEKYRIISGHHTFQAKLVVRKTFRKEEGGIDYEDELPSMAFEEVESVRCRVVEIPNHIHPMVIAHQFNLKHGLKPTDQDLDHVAKNVYADTPGMPISRLAKMLGITRKKCSKIIEPMVEAHEKEKRETILELHNNGLNQAAIADELRKKYPKAKGISQSSVSQIIQSEKDKLSSWVDDGLNQNDQNRGQIELGPGPSGEEPSDIKIENGTTVSNPQSGSRRFIPTRRGRSKVRLEISWQSRRDQLLIAGLKPLSKASKDALYREIKKVTKEFQK